MNLHNDANSCTIYCFILFIFLNCSVKKSNYNRKKRYFSIFLNLSRVILSLFKKAYRVFWRIFKSESNEKELLLGKTEWQRIYLLSRWFYLWSTYIPKLERDEDCFKCTVQGELAVKARYLQGDLSGFPINRKDNYQGKYSKGLQSGRWEYNLGASNYYKNGVLLQKRQVFSVNFNF